MRRLLVTLLVATALAGCGEDEPAPDVPGLIAERSGGISSTHDEIRLADDGTATITRRDGSTAALDEGQTQALAQAVADADFATLDESYEPEGTVDDGVDYRFENGGRTVRLLAQADDVPARLADLRDEVARLLNEN